MHNGYVVFHLDEHDEEIYVIRWVKFDVLGRAFQLLVKLLLADDE
jgi:hypothetical protein